MCVGASLYGQGQVTFANNSTTLVSTNATLIGGGVGSAATTASGGTVKVALYWGVASSSEAQLVQIGATAGISPVAGRINAGIYTTPVETVAGASAAFQVRGWTGGYATYEAAYAAATSGTQGILLGVSSVFSAVTGGAGTPPGAPATLAGAIPSFTLVPVPEPSTIALAGLGAASLLLFRRRK